MNTASIVLDRVNVVTYVGRKASVYIGASSHENLSLGFPTKSAQTNMYSHRRRLEASIFSLKKNSD